MPVRAPDSDRLISVVCGQVADNAPLSGIDVVLAAQHHGFTDVWIGEAATYDVFALATAIGTRTEGLRFTLGPLPVGVRDPVTIARGVASVAILTGQRVDVALGTSSDLVVEGWHGRARTRAVRTLSETAAAVRPLLQGEKSAFSGELVRTSGYQLKLPAPASTVTIAGFGDLAIDAAVRHADRLVINLVTPALAASIAERLGRCGRPGRCRPAPPSGLDPDRGRSERRCPRAASPRPGRLRRRPRLSRHAHRRRVRRAGRIGSTPAAGRKRSSPRCPSTCRAPSAPSVRRPR